ncbi:hypothetical protein [Micromonospora sp. DT31]|uniref:hypothetical protein n=1 Tax=Micromonospora sp. DT31 TaxID=3393434 RepID=UPI003CF8E9C9
MSQPPYGAGDNQHPPAPGGTVYGGQYGSQPAPQQYGPPQPESHPYQQPTSGGYPPAPSQHGYHPGAAPTPPPASVPPVSGPGYTQPMSAPPGAGYPQPMSAPPTSVPPAPGYGQQPMSAPPGAMPPYGPSAAPTGGGRGRAALVLGIVAGLLFVLGGVMTFLYVSTNGDLDRSKQQVSQRNGTIATNQQEIEKLKGELKTVRERLSTTEQDLSGTKNDRDEQTRQKRIIANCLEKLTTALSAASRGDKAAFDAASKGLDKICNEAERYL